MDATLQTTASTTDQQRTLRIRSPIPAFSTAVAALAAAIEHAFTMAYVDPYRPVSPPACMNDSDGRDPNW